MTNPEARRSELLTRLENGHSLAAIDLAREFEISPDAIRRDLRMLAAQGLCRRVYGGALPLSSASGSFAQRERTAHAQKAELARTALSLIEDGMSLFLDSGSTNLELAKIISGANLTVATNSPQIAQVLVSRPGVQLQVIGGHYSELVGGCVDLSAIASLKRMNFDLCFLGACALSSRYGVAAFDASDAAFKRAALRRARRSAVLVTDEKLGTRAMYHVAGVSSVGVVVARSSLTETDKIEALFRSDVEILSAEGSDRDAASR